MQLRDALKRYERDLISNALASSQGNVARTAALLGVAPQTLHYRIRRLGLARFAALSLEQMPRVAAERGSRHAGWSPGL
ncbi:helix-turn-helix domain-containing protein [Xenophilus aerolatus]